MPKFKVGDWVVGAEGTFHSMYHTPLQIGKVSGRFITFLREGETSVPDDRGGWDNRNFVIYKKEEV